MPWDHHSRRRTELPPDWHIIRKDILDRDQHRCRIAGPQCTGRATEVDHVGDRHNHQRSALRAACKTCHAERTTAQGHDAMRQQRAKLRHPTEQHPALTK